MPIPSAGTPVAGAIAWGAVNALAPAAWTAAYSVPPAIQATATRPPSATATRRGRGARGARRIELRRRRPDAGLLERGEDVGARADELSVDERAAAVLRQRDAVE